MCGGEDRHCGQHNNLGAISNRTLATWPRDVEKVFLDFETGNSVWTGGVLATDKPEDSPCRRAYAKFCATNHYWCQGTSRSSWDIQAAVYAVRGLEDMYTLERWRDEMMDVAAHSRYSKFGLFMLMMWNCSIT